MKRRSVMRLKKMITLLFLLNSKDKQFRNLKNEFHDNHLKNLATYPKTVASAQILMRSHSEAVVKTKQHERYCDCRENEIAFA